MEHFVISYIKGYNILIDITTFFSWTFILYWVHRISHVIPYIKQIHWKHHKYVTNTQPKWMWQNIFLYSDDWNGTLDIIVTEIIPTIIFCYFTNQWWILGIYYIWTAFIQEWVEHNPNIYFPPFSAGKTHLVHHKDWTKNYSLFFPIWDIVFKTYKKVGV